MVVALNSDAGVRAIKGAGRPVNRVADRAAVLAALGTVDHVVAFDGHTPLALVEAIRPDVYVKGADHDVLSLPEGPGRGPARRTCAPRAAAARSFHVRGHRGLCRSHGLDGMSTEC